MGQEESADEEEYGGPTPNIPAIDDKEFNLSAVDLEDEEDYEEKSASFDADS